VESEASSVEIASTQGNGVEVENTLQVTEYKGCRDVEKNPHLSPKDEDEEVF
jgi:hypothetical protein